MSNQQMDAKLLARMFLAGAMNLESNKEWINELNVFPVPDGDTGTNMCMTIMSAAKEVDALGDAVTMPVLCKAISSGSLRGARGNSGVILSQLFRGFTKAIKEEETLTVPVLAVACTKAVETAYKAVMKPKEGTILTVAREMSEAAVEINAAGETDVEAFMLQVLEKGKESLARTPELLPVLKEAGVVDSGGQGLIQVITGAIECYQGKEVSLSVSDVTEDAQDDEKDSETKPKFLYLVEYTVVLNGSYNTKKEIDFKSYLETLGENVTLITDGNKLLVHLQTNDPGLCIQKALKYGDIVNVVVINSFLEEGKTVDSALAQEAPKEPPKEYGFVSVSAGDGLDEIFRSLGVDYIIEGGQTMNPSTADFIDAIDKVNAKTVFLLPNNKNIILAANQASELVTDKNVLVIPTRTIPQGITAIINFVADSTADENEAAMMSEIGRVKTGQVTYSIRDTVIDGHEISKDDYMGIGDSGILSNGTDMTQVFIEMLDAMVDDSSELISIYYGSDVKEEDATAISDAVSSKFSSCDVEIQYGGQPIYYYILSVE